MIKVDDLPPRLVSILVDGQWPADLEPQKVAEFLNIPVERRRDFERYHQEQMEVHTKRLVEFARTGGGLNAIYKVWSSAAHDTAPEDYLDAEFTFVLGGSMGYEDMLVLDYRSSPPCVRYFLDEDGRDDWAVVSASIDAFIDAIPPSS